MVRRGYDTAQVDEFVRAVAAGGPPAEFHGFDTARRGYDRAEVDAYVARVRAGGAAAE